MFNGRGQSQLIIILILAAAVIAGAAFYVGRLSGQPAASNNATSTGPAPVVTAGPSSTSRTYTEGTAFSFNYPENFTVNSARQALAGAAVDSITVSGPNCSDAFALELDGPYSGVSTASNQWWLASLKSQYANGFNLESENSSGNVQLFRFTNAMGSSFRKFAVWIDDNSPEIRVNAFYDASALNYNQTTGQKIDPNQGSTLTNPCQSAFENILSSVSFHQ